MAKSKLEKVWEPHIGKMQMQAGKDKVEEVPVFSWSYRGKFAYGGEIHAYPHLGILLFQTKRGDYDDDPGFKGNLQEVLKEIDSFGWGKPPNIEEVYNDIQAASTIAKNNGNRFFQHCKELETKWQTYLK